MTEILSVTDVTANSVTIIGKPNTLLSFSYRGSACSAMIPSSGSFDLHFLFPSSSIILRAPKSKPLTVKTLPVSAVGPLRPTWNMTWPYELYVFPEALEDLSWCMRAPMDWMWTSNWNSEFICALLRHGLFTLPDRPGLNSCLMLPNPQRRFCIDLLNPFPKKRRNRIMRVSRLAEYRLSVNNDFEGSLRALIKAHEFDGGTWFTEDLLHIFQRQLQEEKSGQKPGVQHRVFELWDANNGELLAVTAGYGAGKCFHDYSMRCIVRDKRSCGHVLTKIVANVLKECGYQIWYWGFKLGYMNSLSDAGFGRDFDRDEFWKRWSTGLNAQEPPKDIYAFIREGRAMIRSKEAVVHIKEESREK